MNFGFRPHCINGQSEVDQHIAGIKNLSPLFNLFFFLGLIKAKDANKLADEPEFTIKAYLEPINFANLYSNSSVILDIVIFWLSKTSVPLKISSVENALLCKG